MVEKIDKPDPSPAYFIQSTTETKDDRGGGKQQQSDEYSGSHAAPGWQKLYAASSSDLYVKLVRENVARVWFRNTIMQKGISFAEIDIETKDGRILKNAHVILAAREDFWTLKKFQLGQEIPLNLIVKEPVLEISIPVPRPAAASAPLKEEAANKGNKISTKQLIIYVAIGLAALLLIILTITR